MSESMKRYQDPETSDQDQADKLADLYSLIKSHRNFSHFVEIVYFHDYLKFFTNSDANIKNNSASQEVNDSEMAELLKSLAESVTSPNVIDLIVKNLIKSQR